jgi:hypothetical protein
MSAAPSPLCPSRRRESVILLLTGIAALGPYVLHRRLFLQMYWFGDEFDLVDQISRLGFWHWVWLAFAENFVPLFKVLWGGAVISFGGSYAAMIAIGWVVHALNVSLLGRLMRTCGLSWGPVLAAQVVFALSVANCETLAWSVQWSATLSVAFMLAGLDRAFSRPGIAAPLGYSLASGLSFSRGVLSGPLIGCASFLRDKDTPFPRRLGKAALFLAPAAVVTGLIFAFAKGNQHSIGQHLGEAATYGVWYFCLNPVHELLRVESWGWRTTAILGLAKVSLYVWSLLRSRGRTRELFIVLVLLDLANAVLLGIGRYHTGLPSTVSSRYQYAALVSFMPLAGFWLTTLWDRLPTSAVPRNAILGLLLAGLALFLCWQWPVDLVHFAEWRGTRSRRILFVDVNPGSQAVPGIPELPMDRAKALIAAYHLH